MKYLLCLILVTLLISCGSTDCRDFSEIENRIISVIVKAKDGGTGCAYMKDITFGDPPVEQGTFVICTQEEFMDRLGNRSK